MEYSMVKWGNCAPWVIACVVSVGLVGGESRDIEAEIDLESGCPQTNPAESHSGTTLEQFANDSGDGVVYDDVEAALRLKKAGGLFTSTLFPITDFFVGAAAADFDNDGWTDIMGSGFTDGELSFYKNRTYENPEPDWDDPTDIRIPKFPRTTILASASSASTNRNAMTAADFDNDGNQDLAFFRNVHPEHSSMNTYVMYLGNGDGTFQSPYTLSTGGSSQFGYLMYIAGQAQAGDYDNDGWIDIMFALKMTTSPASAEVAVFLNDCPDTFQQGTPCTQTVRFQKQTVLDNLNFGTRGPAATAYVDVNQDGTEDLLIGSPSTCAAGAHTRLYLGLPGGGFDTGYQTLAGIGAANTILAADFTLDGQIDVIYSSDEFNCGSHAGGQTFFLRSDGTGAPYAGGVTQQLTPAHYSNGAHGGGNFYDADSGAVLDYDHDPDNTTDLFIADGNDAATYFMFANRTTAQYVPCGEVASGTLDLGDLSDDEMVVTGARLSPTMFVPDGGSVTFSMTNVSPEDWVVATPCADDPDDYCATFPSVGGREVKWKADMCSPAPGYTETPTLSGVEIAFDYALAREHFRGGTVVYDGVAYVGGLRQPGNRGKFYAANADLTATYWEAGAKLDAMDDADRNIYTATIDGATRLGFSAANASDADLQTTLSAADSTEAAAIIDWQRSARFGVGNAGIALTRLGAVEGSTPAVLSVPAPPFWYELGTDTDRAAIDTFIADHADRKQLVLVASRDGALHAFYNEPTSISSTQNGTEAWAFIPAKVAFGFQADMSAGTATSYPDGSPTLADVRLSDGTFHTVAVVGGGGGSRAVFALDVTETVSEVDGTTVLGPTPLWHLIPGGAEAGQAISKPLVIRTSVSGSEKFQAVMASGPSSADPTPPYGRGKTVVGADVETGAELWRFEARCSVTSDLSAFETNDDAEPGTPDIDGYVDRVVFADECGYVYKVDPAAESSGGYVAGAGPIAVVWDDDGDPLTTDVPALDPDGNEKVALFYVGPGGTAGALGEERPIAGAIAARADTSKRIVLFFGTGGETSYDATKTNAFYAVYADTGELRTSFTGDCPASASGRCEKFYGGAVATVDQIITARTLDPPVGTGSCDTGSSTITGFDVDEAADEFVEDFSQPVTSAIVSNLFAHGGAVYVTTVAGEAARVGSPRAADAGDDSAGGFLGGSGAGDGDAPGSGAGEMVLRGWRQVL
jgi:hypothetical protein